jgi:hypothetical protein
MNFSAKYKDSVVANYAEKGLMKIHRKVEKNGCS